MKRVIPQDMYKKLVLNHVLIPGVYYIEEGNIVFDSISLEDYQNRVKLGIDDNVAYYTRSMGRGIFTVGKNGEIINYKGVDSGLDSGEVKKCNISSLLNRNQSRHEIVVTYFKHGSYSGHIKKPQIRVKGASQLQDLISEYEKLNKYKQCQLIKFPEIFQVKPLTQNFCLKYDLPIQVEITEDFIRRMQNEDNSDERKGVVGKSRIHCIEQLRKLGVSENTRFQTWQEYFDSLSDQEKKSLQYVPELQTAISEEDRRYGLGAMFGQAKRVLENPFRISDLDYYVKHKDSAAVVSILEYSQLFYDEDFLLTYADIMGKNVAGFMNQKIANHLWSHRQDFALSAEICDEAYNDVSINISKDDYYRQYKRLQKSKYDNGFENISFIIEDQVKYYAQIFLFASNMKVIENAYILSGINVPDNYQNRFIESFIDNLANRENVVKNIITWAIRLFGESGELVTFLGKRAANTIAGYEEYIKDIIQRLKEC